ncbi:Phage conserved hypothetical protein, C-terminal [uncultured Caudovirales phage]|uniref:Uncharacterized protein n=1 Tax=uncultured Caudovirales phage TaxID=2100421 RepID=A0A6J5MPC9_9CAUD|nr:Phage conserved hypothetical protein, C-terminal [uncultured Caudovirales phage]
MGFSLFKKLIMEKLTKRKGFNFFRSYFDVYNELQSNEDKVAFIDALLDRQFLGIKPTNLKGMAKFAYVSQTNSIDSQVKGYEDKTGNIFTPTVGGSVGGIEPPCLQVEVEVKEKVKDIDHSVNWDALLSQFNSITGKKMRVVCDKTKRQVNARLKEGYSKQDIVNAITNCFNDDYHKQNPHFLTLEFISRADKMQKYAQEIIKPKAKQQDRL